MMINHQMKIRWRRVNLTPMMTPHHYYKSRHFARLHWVVYANKRATNDGESKVFKRYLVLQAKSTKEGKIKYYG
jgi:hypothetical protein